MQDNRRWIATAIGVLWLLARIADMSATNWALYFHNAHEQTKPPRKPGRS